MLMMGDTWLRHKRRIWQVCGEGGGWEWGVKNGETVANARARPHDFLLRNGCGYMRQGRLGNR